MKQTIQLLQAVLSVACAVPLGYSRTSPANGSVYPANRHYVNGYTEGENTTQPSYVYIQRPKGYFRSVLYTDEELKGLDENQYPWEVQSADSVEDDSVTLETSTNSQENSTFPPEIIDFPLENSTFPLENSTVLQDNIFSQENSTVLQDNSIYPLGDTPLLRANSISSLHKPPQNLFKNPLHFDTTKDVPEKDLFFGSSIDYTKFDLVKQQVIRILRGKFENDVETVFKNVHSSSYRYLHVNPDYFAGVSLEDIFQHTRNYFRFKSPLEAENLPSRTIYEVRKFLATHLELPLYVDRGYIGSFGQVLQRNKNFFMLAANSSLYTDQYKYNLMVQIVSRVMWEANMVPCQEFMRDQFYHEVSWREFFDRKAVQLGGVREGPTYHLVPLDAAHVPQRLLGCLPWAAQGECFSWANTQLS
ncbi:uncharacterized protein LOC108674635 [Hyalella azteca]|uniref:Uncharacterized protein LOC108674635 n=1 Tax=Hyalella azteca TaxID=294128 RepID=A0A8B7NYY3_HYAAZ|nr:uncharacterized protein LOC108674635 [Hyalella azteca]